MMLESVDTLCRISKPLEDADVVAPWKAAEVAICRAGLDSDVLSILATPFSPKLSSPARRLSLRQIVQEYRIGKKELYAPRRRNYEVLSECPERTSKFSEPRSFNRALTRSFNILLDEMPKIPFTTEHLQRLMLLDPTRRHMEVELRSQLGADDRKHIFLSAPVNPGLLFRLGKQGNETKAVNTQWDSILQKNSLLLTAAMADDKWGEDLENRPNTLDDELASDIEVDSNAVVDEVAAFLWRDWCLYRLYRRVPGKMGRKQFVRVHNPILMNFVEAARLEVNDKRLLDIVRQIQYPSQQTRISERLYELCNSPTGSNFQPNWTETLDPISMGKYKEEYLDLVPRAQVPAFLERHKRYEEDYLQLVPLAEGQAFHALWNDLHALLAPYLSVHNALSSGNTDILRMQLTQNFHNAISLGSIDSLRSILAEHFDIVAVGEFAWITELEEAGYTRVEIADLLYEEAWDAAWIFFEPEVLDQEAILPDEEMHIQGCVHQVLNDTHQRSPTRPLLREEDSSTTYQIQELCGLAGITPSSRDRERWNGSVSFEQQGTVAVVSYAVADEMIVCDRITATLERLCSAAGRLQSRGYCCNNFTALVENHDAIFSSPRQIKVYCVQLRDAVCLLKEMKVLASRGGFDQRASDYSKPVEAALRILSPFGFHVRKASTRHDSVQLLSIAAQFLSLSFLCYNQGHIGPIQPFFLDTALSGISLTGVSRHSPWQLAVAYAKLTCMGDMLESPVLTFCIRQEDASQIDITGRQKFDLLTTAEDLLDTWGPGNFILPKVDDQPLPCAIKIGGGTICSYRPTTNVVKFHWTNNMRLDEAPQPVCFDPRSEILIGGFVSVNPGCQIDEKESWNKSCSAFENLGVHDESWTHDEKQTGVQAGQYVILQQNRIKHKIPGKSLKQYYLGQDAETLVCMLNCLWGLQVSFCTGVTRRVPLRMLVAELLPYFAKLLPRGWEVWKELHDRHDVISGFRTDNVQGCLETLPPDLYAHVLQLIARILVALQPTGIDNERKFLRVAWLYDCPPFRCFRIPCHDKSSSWVRVLADSEDCATFAYISTSCCLETPTIKCRGFSSPLWHNSMPLLETAIVRHNETPSKPLGPLEDKKAYFFKKLGSVLQVTVERKECSSQPVSLLVSTSSIPTRFWQRIYAMEMKKNQRSRIWERQKADEVGAEIVTILAKSESS